MTDQLVDFSGAPEQVRLLVTKIQDEGDRIRVETQTTPFARRFAFIAPNNTPEFPEDVEYAHISDNDGRMSDGSEPYRIL